MQRSFAYGAAVALLASTAAFASDHSMEDQIACTPDVYRLCSQYIPDEGTITACLQRNVANLSPACHKVFTRPAPAPGTDPDADD